MCTWWMCLTVSFYINFGHFLQRALGCVENENECRITSSQVVYQWFAFSVLLYCHENFVFWIGIHVTVMQKRNKCKKLIQISKSLLNKKNTMCTIKKNRFIPAEILFSPETDILGKMKFLLNNFFISSTVVILSDPPLR